ncbi:nuclear transport factor 2 family protein [Pigmentiphaga aceris]|uniref:Nuclear transport factor 2 family protein n=2 Tax=Pigmentiphaga aceris TaxID=1940612 RepID=A0A5C0B8N8_9BURK|nr:nuclear transport factor 2 family protein [Pigmentiphaga aceris]
MQTHQRLDAGADDKLKAVLDREEIRNLRSLYAHFLDGNLLDRLDDIFTVDAVADTGRGQWNGRQEIRDGLRAAFQEYDRDGQGRYPFMHAVTNHWIEILGPDIAEGRCYLIDFETASKPDPNPLLLLGIYADEYKRVDGNWRISRSRLEHIWPQRNGGGGTPGDGLVLPE